MAHTADDIRQDIADTQHDIDNTRSAMTEKLEMLEERVRETVEDAQSTVEDIVENVKDMVGTTVEAVRQGVEGAQSTVEDIVENVKDTVDTTVATVQRTLNLHYQVDQHPWLMFGGSLLAGYLLGSWGSSSTSATVSTHDPQGSAAGTTAASSSESFARPQPQQGMGSGVLDQFKEEIAILKSAAVAVVISTLRDMVRQALLPAVPPIKSDMTKGGTHPIKSPAQTPAALSSTAVNRNAPL
jgi:ElaB/YqjD/DUF883 family membrane-anchored ribosome-binding protein